ncbi:hypothetical protein [Helicobacter pylori]|uniref:hypothetical protein n=1 Tax=Helicobacter pylori TaxID=210 RepID=UPI0009AD87ED|nr:hypothetical protein [Helicobacter pylori]
MRVPLPAASMMTESIKILKLVLGNFNMLYLIIWLRFIKDLRLEFAFFHFFNPHLPFNMPFNER